MSCLRLVGALVFVVGCSTPALPPLMGFSKFAHSASVDPEIGKLTATTGALIDVANGTNSSGSVSAFHAEGALSVWLAPFYDLTLGAGPWMLGVEGNIMPVHTPTVRFGIIHGIGTSLLASWDNTPGSSGSTTLFFDFSVGPFVQFTLSKAASIFFGAKYTFSTFSQVSGGTAPENNTHYVGFGMGAPLLVVGRLHLTPELVATYYTFFQPNNSTTPPSGGAWVDGWLITPMLSASVPF